MPAITEIITQFIALFRVEIDPDRTWIYVDGAGKEHTQLIDLGQLHAPPRHPALPPEVASLPCKASHLAFDEPNAIAVRAQNVHVNGTSHVAPINFAKLHPTAQPSGDSGTTVSSAATEISSIAPTQVVVDDHQVNTLIGNTVYLDHLSLSGNLPIPHGAQLNHLVAQAHQIFITNGPDLGKTASAATTTIKAYDDGLATASAPSNTLTKGTFTDGALTSSDGSPVAVKLPVDQLDMTTPIAQNVALGRVVVTGHDVSGNAAVINDTVAAPLNTIVEGNAFQTDIIIQVNVLQNVDAIVTNSVDAIATGANTVHNVAHFEQLPLVVGTTVNGNLGQFWHVQVVNGDYYDVSTVTQTNYLVNNALYVGASSTDHYYAALASNTQLNAVDITHDAPSFDLLIVLGNSYSANMIHQSNVLLNDTHVAVAFAPGGGTDTISTGQNTLTNEASITEYGATQWSVVSRLSNDIIHSLETGGAMSALFPTDSFTGSANVLVVIGDYYHLNLISQTNIVSNSANILSDMTTAGVSSPATVLTGQDTLANSAAIVSAGTLGSQYVAGQPYQTAMLIQSNIVTTQSAINTPGSAAFVTELEAYMNPDTLDHVSVLTTHAASAATLQHNDVLAATLH